MALATAMSAMKGKVPAAAFQHAAQTLLAYVRNLVAHPDDPKFRRIKVSPVVHIRIWGPHVSLSLACWMLCFNIFPDCRSPTRAVLRLRLLPGCLVMRGSRVGLEPRTSAHPDTCVSISRQSSNARYKAAIGGQPHGPQCMAALGFRPIMEASEEVQQSESSDWIVLRVSFFLCCCPSQLGVSNFTPCC